MGGALEASSGRIRYHLRRPIPGRGKLLNENARNTVNEIVPVDDLYITRGVLLHLGDPWSFLNSIAIASPGAFLLVEYQRLELIFANEVWYQISHDHVNLSREEDFRQRFEIVASGTFGNHERQWILLRVGVKGDFDQVEVNIGQSTSVALAESFLNLANEREKFLESFLIVDNPIAIWGTAGKGILLVHSIASIRDQLDAIYDGPDRWDLYLEGSGSRVKASEEAMQT
jgi:hypothetical protein